MPHVLIKYAHVLICISVGEGSWHFSAFHFLSDLSTHSGCVIICDAWHLYSLYFGSESSQDCSLGILVREQCSH